jgi:uncharacterized cupredoxin-like copper-binding protein
MFLMNLPLSVQIGDTHECKINKLPARVTWRDKNTLVIEPGDARRIESVFEQDGMRTFICGDAEHPEP